MPTHLFLLHFELDKYISYSKTLKVGIYQMTFINSLNKSECTLAMLNDFWPELFLFWLLLAEHPYEYLVFLRLHCYLSV